MNYRPEVDGLRALSVIPVIFFHAGFDFMAGGFIGVDVFFVISGYLISTILIRDLKLGRFDIFGFYERRARRILPALGFVVAVTLPFSVLWLDGERAKDYFQSIFALGLFASNVLFWREGGYFSFAAEEKPLLHTWSLAVEEQFYVVFPFLLLVAWRLGARASFVLFLSLAGLSLGAAEFMWRFDARGNFFLIFGRAWELLVGVLCALYIERRGVQRSEGLVLLGLLILFVSMTSFHEGLPIPGIFMLLPVSGAALVILFSGGGGIFSRFLSVRPLVFIGLISYSAYLWHHALFAFVRIRLHQPSDVLFLVLVFCTFGLAWLSWRFVETPFRDPVGLLRSRRSVFLSSGALLFIFLAVGFSGHLADGFPSFPKSRASLSDFAERISPNHGVSKECKGWGDGLHHCRTDSVPEILLWGDSYAMHLFHGLESSGDDVGILQATMSSCPPILGVSRINVLQNRGQDWAKRCLEFNQSVFSALVASESIKTVVLSSRLDWLGQESVFVEGQGSGDASEDALSAYLDTIQRIKEAGKAVIVVSAPPRSGFNTGRCVGKRRFFTEDLVCDFVLDDKSYNRAAFQSLSEQVPVYWLEHDICDEGICKAEIDGVVIYRDGGHLSREGSRYLGQNNNWAYKFRHLSAEHLEQ